MSAVSIILIVVLVLLVSGLVALLALFVSSKRHGPLASAFGTWMMTKPLFANYVGEKASALLGENPDMLDDILNDMEMDEESKEIARTQFALMSQLPAGQRDKLMQAALEGDLETAAEVMDGAKQDPEEDIQVKELS